MEQPDLLRLVIGILERLHVPYMVVGSIASSAWGEPRLTQDIDIVIDLRLDQVGPLCANFPLPEFYISPEAVLQAVRTQGQFNVIHPGSANKIDFMLTRPDPWGQSQIARREKKQLLPGQPAYVGRPEDIIISKMLYYQEGGSEKHLRDIAGILKVSGDQVDHAYVQQWAEKLGLTEIWHCILRRLTKP